MIVPKNLNKKTVVEIKKFPTDKDGKLDKEGKEILCRLVFATYKAAQYYVKAAGMAQGVISITIMEVRP